MARWRTLLAALRYGMPGPGKHIDDQPPREIERTLPMIGLLVGILGALVYWLAAEVWPASVALILSMFVTALATGEVYTFGSARSVFAVLIKYNTLMALSAAHLPIALPEHAAVGLIMVAGHVAGRALMVSVLTSDLHPLISALGFAVLADMLLGIPGLVGLAAALAIRIVLGAIVLPKLSGARAEQLAVTQQFTEIGVYLGALAAWRYV